MAGGNGQTHMQTHTDMPMSTRASLEAQGGWTVLTKEEVGQQDYGGGVYRQDVTILMGCCWEATGWRCLDCLGVGVVGGGV